MSAIVAFAIVAGIVWFGAQSYSNLWRTFSFRYAGPNEPIVGNRLDTVVILRRGKAGAMEAYRHYAGTVLALTPTGLRFGSVAPLNVFAAAFTIPFDEMELGRATWKMWPEPSSIRAKKVPHCEIIVGVDTLRWIRSLNTGAPFVDNGPRL